MPTDEEGHIALMLLGFTPAISSDTWKMVREDTSITYRGYRISSPYIRVTRNDIYFYSAEELEEWLLNYEKVT